MTFPRLPFWHFDFTEKLDKICKIRIFVSTSGSYYRSHFFRENEVPYHFGKLWMSTFHWFKWIFTKAKRIHVIPTNVRELFFGPDLISFVNLNCLNCKQIQHLDQNGLIWNLHIYSNFQILNLNPWHRIISPSFSFVWYLLTNLINRLIFWRAAAAVWNFIM